MLYFAWFLKLENITAVTKWNPNKLGKVQGVTQWIYVHNSYASYMSIGYMTV